MVRKNATERYVDSEDKKENTGNKIVELDTWLGNTGLGTGLSDGAEKP